MIMSRCVPLLALTVFLAGCGSLMGTGSLTLVKDGQPGATIVLSDKPTRAAQLAALELQEHVRLITGATLPIVDENAKVEGVGIYVGKTKMSPDDFKSQEYAVSLQARLHRLGWQGQGGLRKSRVLDPQHRGGAQLLDMARAVRREGHAARRLRLPGGLLRRPLVRPDRVRHRRPGIQNIDGGRKRPPPLPSLPLSRAAVHHSQHGAL